MRNRDMPDMSEWKRERTKLLPKNIYLCTQNSKVFMDVTMPLAKVFKEAGLCVETPMPLHPELSAPGVAREIDFANRREFGYFIPLGEGSSVEGPFVVTPLSAASLHRLASFEKILTLKQTIAMARHPYTEQYVLDDDGDPVPVVDTIAWGMKMQTRHAKFNLKHYCWFGFGVPSPFGSVSTVFLGLDHSFGRSEPLLYETMIFGGPLDQEQWRYSNESEARAGHKNAVRLVWAYSLLFWRHNWFHKSVEWLVNLIYRPKPKEVLKEAVKELKERAKDDPVSTVRKD